MPKITYSRKRFSREAIEIVAIAETIINDYTTHGFDLTLRQLYYQFVARGLIPNKDSEYKRLGNIISDARMAGLIDWSRIKDRTRDYESNAHWDSPADIIRVCAKQFQIDKWQGQRNYVEVWVEKDALEGVVKKACSPLDVGFFSCRGYTSQTALWEAGQRMKEKIEDEERFVTILHLGDHDPSGMDMTRDIRDRLETFIGESHEGYFQVKRIALTSMQVQIFNPPPNPAKLTDSRCKQYMLNYGDESWELDALDPKVLVNLIQSEIKPEMDRGLWGKMLDKETEQRKQLQEIADKWLDQ